MSLAGAGAKASEGHPFGPETSPARHPGPSPLGWEGTAQPPATTRPARKVHPMPTFTPTPQQVDEVRGYVATWDQR